VAFPAGWEDMAIGVPPSDRLQELLGGTRQAQWDRCSSAVTLDRKKGWMQLQLGIA